MQSTNGQPSSKYVQTEQIIEKDLQLNTTYILYQALNYCNINLSDSEKKYPVLLEILYKNTRIK